VGDTGAGRLPLDRDTAAGGAGWRLEVLAAHPSTNALVAQRARCGEAEGLVVVAEHQTAGRGRLDRSWVTPPRAALTFSVLLRPREVPAQRWPWLPLMAGLAVVAGIARASGVTASLKWPNDVLVPEDGRLLKVAGVLAERVETRGGGGAAAVLGVGLNVTTSRQELPVPTATSLLLAGASAPDRSALLAAVLDALSDGYAGWRTGGRGLRASYAAACSTLGREVRVDLPTGAPLVGTALDVDEDGRLLVDDGERVHALGAGDVVHLRPGAGPGSAAAAGVA
jgi:BirA family biotin operon repressor/biotin-[acetyl-CoA-carboxylase] ligase